jgi:hypothetical protein
MVFWKAHQQEQLLLMLNLNLILAVLDLGLLLMVDFILTDIWIYSVSNSVRYTTNFTPPTSAFTVDDNTTIIFNFDGPNGSQDFELLQLLYSSTDIVADADVDVTGVSATISLPNITNGLTLSNTYQSLTNLGSITGRNQNIVFQSDSNGILLKSSYTDAEIWWEAGGTTVGAWLGIAKINNAYFIRFRTGSGAE